MEMTKQDEEIMNLKKEIMNLKKEICEYEAIEKYIMEKLKKNCKYEDVLKAHYREGKVVDGEWIDEEEEDEDEEKDDNIPSWDTDDNQPSTEVSSIEQLSIHTEEVNHKYKKNDICWYNA